MKKALLYNLFLSQGGGGSGDPADVVGVNTTADGRQAILVIGDSIANGSNNTTGPGPTPVSGTVYQWNGTDVIEIGADDVYNIPVGGGSMMPQMGITRYNASGYKSVFIPMGSSGAEMCFPYLDNNNFTASGTRRAITEGQVTDCLADLSLTQLRAICVVGFINDSRSANTLADILTGMTSFFDWITTTYPGVPVLFSQIGKDGSNINTQRIYTIAKGVIDRCATYDDCHMVFNNRAWIGSGGYGADNLHPNQTGQNQAGDSFGRWLGNYQYSKWARSIMSSMFSDITPARKSGIQTAVASIGADYFKLESLHFLKMSNAFDFFSDWTFLGYITNVSAVVTLNQYVTTASVQTFSTSFNPAIQILRASQTDTFTMAKIKNVYAATSGTLFGISNSGFYRCTQGGVGTSLQYVVNDGTSGIYNTTDRFAANTCYGCARNGGTKYLLENGSVLHSTVQAVTGLPNRNMRFGAIDAGTVSSYLNADLEYVASGRYSDVDVPNLVTALNTLASSW
jgi:hypothetical protein